MASPITWQNVTAANNESANKMLLAGQAGLSNGLGALGNVLKQQQAVEDGNWTNQRTNNTQAFIDELGKFRTPAELQAAQQDGTLDVLRNGNTGPIDVAAARAAQDARLPHLQQEVTNNQIFADKELATKHAPIMDRISAHYAKGEFEAGDALVAANPDLTNKASLVKDRTSSFNAIAAANAAAELQPLQHKNAMNQQVLLSQQIDAGRKTATDAALVNNAITASMNAYQQKEGERTSALGALIKEFGVGTLPDGSPDVSKLSPDQATAFKERIKTAGLDVPVSTSELKAKLLQTLGSQGVSPTGIASANVTADTLFRSKPSLSAEDIENKDRALTALKTRVDKANKSNIFYSDPLTHVNDRAAVLTAVETEVTDGPSTRGTIREKLSEWMDTGIEVTQGGKTTLVKVPPKVVQAAFAKDKQTDTWMYNGTWNNMEGTIKKMMQDDQYMDLRKEADYLHAGGEAGSREAIEAYARRQSGTSNPVDMVERLTFALDARARAADPKQQQATVGTAGNVVKPRVLSKQEEIANRYTQGMTTWTR